MVSKRVLEAWNLYKQGLSYEEIAKKMDITTGTVRKYISKARKELEGNVVEQIVPKKKSDSELKKIKEEIKNLHKEIENLANIIQNIQKKLGTIEDNYGYEISKLAERIKAIENKIESMNQTISVPKTISITEQMQKAISDYEKLMEVAKKYFEIQKLLGNVWLDAFGFESTTSWRHNIRSIDRKGYYATFGRFYGIAHVTTIEDWWKGKKELKEWYIVWLQGRKLLTKDEVIRRMPTIKRQLMEAISRLPKIIEYDLPRHPENTEKVEKLYNELVELLKGENQ